jgi:hypothetical protein
MAIFSGFGRGAKVEGQSILDLRFWIWDLGFATLLSEPAHPEFASE